MLPTIRPRKVSSFLDMETLTIAQIGTSASDTSINAYTLTNIKHIHIIYCRIMYCMYTLIELDIDIIIGVNIDDRCVCVFSRVSLCMYVRAFTNKGNRGIQGYNCRFV